MPRISVLETPALIAPGEIAGHAAAVIDVLRATSSIITALSSGCRAVIPAGGKEEAVRLRSSYHDALLGGEIGGQKIEGFDLGNSPAEYTKEAVGGRKVIMSTSNGTKAVLGAALGGADPILICSFLNLDAVARELLREARESEKDVTVICSGSLGRFSLEDFACAGALVNALKSGWRRGECLADGCPNAGEFILDEGASRASGTFDSYGGDLARVFLDSPHGQDLKALGYGADLVLCAKLSSISIVPRVEAKVIVAEPSKPYTQHTR